MLFVEWQSQAEDQRLDVRELEYVFQQEMANPNTLMVIRTIFGETESLWPGVELQMTEAAGLAMLGTSNGCGVAWLLATHKEQFGKRTIQSVRVWADDT